MNLLAGLALMAVAQCLTWLQINSQFFNDWAKRNPFVLSAIFGTLVSYIFIYATRYLVIHFNGLLWPGRMVSFAVGIIIMTTLTWWFMDESINTRTIISICLAIIMLIVQIYWK
jgi:hypothetical protein